LAIGFNAGSSPVHVTSSASGGRGGTFDQNSFEAIARGGEARAAAFAGSFGEVLAHATAASGRPRGLFGTELGNEVGAAFAEAQAHGASGEARADAHTSGFELRALRATTAASVSLDSAPWIESKAALGDPFFRTPFRDMRDALAHATGRPTAGDVQSAVQGTTQVAAAFSGDAIDIVLSLGQVGFKAGTDGDGASPTRHAEFEVVPDALAVSVLQDAIVGFMRPEFIGDGFDSLRFQAKLRGQMLADESFEELDEALAYFDDRVLDLGNFSIGINPPPTYSPLELFFDWTGSEQSGGFGVDFIVGVTPVPEPSTALLLAIGLAALAERARRRRALI
jgi:hypothetical protein